MSIDYLFSRLQEIIQVIAEDCYSDYYVPNVEIKDFNVFNWRKNFFDLPVKNEEEAYEKIIERAIIMTTQLVIYWILLISKNVTD